MQLREENMEDSPAPTWRLWATGQEGEVSSAFPILPLCGNTLVLKPELHM